MTSLMRERSTAVLVVFIAIVVTSQLPRLWESVQVNLVGIRLSRPLVGFSPLDVWNAPAQWDTQSTELGQLRVLCITADRPQKGAYLLGLCGWIVGDLDLAQQSFAIAKSSHPELAGLFQGRVYDYAGDAALAVSTWESAGVLPYLLDFAWTLRLQGRFGQAVDLYETLVSGQPDTLDLLDLRLTLASAYVEMQDYDRAGVVLDAALSQDPNNLVAQSLSMYVLAFGEGRFEDALLVGQRLLSEPGLSDDRRADVYWRLGTIERLLGNTRAAVDYFTQYKALQVKPNWYSNLVIAQTYRMGGSLDEALAHIEQALSEAPNQPLCLTERGIIRLRVGQIGPALADLQLAVGLQPDNVGLRVSVAKELHRAGQTAIACEMLREAFELDSTNESIIQALRGCP
jgi:tetratricopeptide (TPR) repeat protein